VIHFFIQSLDICHGGPTNIPIWKNGLNQLYRLFPAASPKRFAGTGKRNGSICLEKGKGAALWGNLKVFKPVILHFCLEAPQYLTVPVITGS